MHTMDSDVPRLCIDVRFGLLVQIILGGFSKLGPISCLFQKKFGLFPRRNWWSSASFTLVLLVLLVM